MSSDRIRWSHIVHHYCMPQEYCGGNMWLRTNTYAEKVTEMLQTRMVAQFGGEYVVMTMPSQEDGRASIGVYCVIGCCSPVLRCVALCICQCLCLCLRMRVCGRVSAIVCVCVW